MPDFLSFLGAHQLKFLTLHILGVALGLGGATISDILFFKFLKDFQISKKEEEVLHLMKNIILGALFLIIVSGIAVYLTDTAKYNASSDFMVKAIGVMVVTLNGILLHVYVAPHLIHLNLKKHKKMGRNWHRFAFALGAISIVSWYSVFLIAMLKSIITLSFWELLGAYITALILGIVGSQAMEMILCRKAKR